eukprot:jgi/Botrbrau1/13310/Bobra.0315s0008.1
MPFEVCTAQGRGFETIFAKLGRQLSRAPAVCSLEASNIADSHRTVLSLYVCFRRGPQVSDSTDWLKGEQMPGASQNRQLPESVWELKPAWCQPWSILMAGVAVPLAAYNISGGSVLLAVLLSIPVSMWWYTFLVLYPAGYREYRASQRITQSMDEDDGGPI